MNWNALLPELVLPFGILLLFFLDLLLDKRHFRASPRSWVALCPSLLLSHSFL
jgi:hypothetical protein